jgi:hypothetical protein
MPTSPKPVREFRGLNNVDDPIRLSLVWATQADNVDVTSKNSLSRCKGFVRRTTNTALTGAYATKDLQRLYVVDSGVLKQVLSDLTFVTLKSGLSSGDYSFEEVNGVVYFTNGVDYGVIETTGWRPWGIVEPVPPKLAWGTGSLPQGIYQVVCTFVDDRGMESGNSEVALLDGSGRVLISDIPQAAGYTTNVYVTMCDGTVFYLLAESAPAALSYDSTSMLGQEITYWGTNAPQRGKFPASFQSQIYLADWYPTQDTTHIWNSLPLQYHHFDFGSEGLAVPGGVRVLKGAKDFLLIGTDRAIFAFDGDKLEQLADYGVVPGWHAAEIDGKLMFWTLRGLCRAMPFENMTEETVSVAPGLSAGAAVIESDGLRRYVVALHTGGEAYNRR